MADLGKSLSLEEAQRLVAVADKEAIQRHTNANKWPSLFDLRLLAEAVANRKVGVTFEGGKRFRIKYDDKKTTVFIKPFDGAFVPCGYFTYAKLKESLLQEKS